MIKNVIILIIVSLIILSGCISSKDSKDEEYEYNYEINIYSNGNKDFSIILPILINKMGLEKSDIMNNLKIIGNGSYQLLNTIYGQGLNISGKGNINIFSKGKEKMEWAFLSLKNDTNSDGSIFDESPGKNIEFWIFFQYEDNVTLEIEIYSSIRHGSSYMSSEISKFKISKPGWQIIYGEESIEGA